MTTAVQPIIILPGGSGFLGQSLIPQLLARGCRIIVLARKPLPSPDEVQYVAWDAVSPGPWIEHVNNARAIINLVGRSVDCRKTAVNRRMILESRVNSVRALAHACGQVSNPPPVWIQSATAHIYGDTDEEILDESSRTGTGLAPDVGRAWEAALNSADLPRTRRVILRISFVLGRSGGALKTLARITRCFLGGTVGSGQQYISWLHITDLANIILRALERDDMHGVYVATSPNPVTNREFMGQLRKALGRPWSPPTPAPLVRLGSIMLRTDPELALLGRRCVPARLSSEGFRFEFPDLSSALHDLLVRK